MLGRIFGLLGYRFARRHRKVALESLKVAFPHLSDGEREKIARDSFVLMGQGALELLSFLKRPSYLEGIRIEGGEHLDRALAQKKGVIGLTAHFGNFPLISLKFVEMGYKVNVMARPMRDPKTGDYVEKLREKAGIKTILSYPRRECVNDTIRALRNNEIVIIQMDQNFGTGGVWVKFFGRLAATPVGPIVFALRTKAVIVPMYIVREGLGKHCIRIFPPVDLDIREDKDETVLVNAIKLTGIIEEWVKDNPDHWSWIHRRWKSRPSPRVRQMKFKIQND